MNRLTIDIDLEHAAFDTNPEEEVARILRALSARLTKPYQLTACQMLGTGRDRVGIPLYDANGKTVGYAAYLHTASRHLHPDGLRSC